MTKDRSLNEFRAALHGLRAALIRPGVLPTDDNFVLGLSPDAGRRFESWLISNQDVIGPDWIMLDPKSDNPIRQVRLDGFAIRWPTGRVAVRDDRGAIPRPVPDVVYGPEDLPRYVDSDERGPRP